MSATAAEPDEGRNAGVNANAVLAIVAVAQFMVILDASIVNVALPTIRHDVGFSEQSLSWILNAYTLIFGGFLLLGGRLADRLGRRRLFMAGIALFTAASLVCGVSQSEGELLVARGLQGLGGAMVSPAALSIILTTFAEGPERNRALSVWGAIAGAGGAVGLLLGGLLVQALSWRWVFFVNVPIGAVVLTLAPRIVPESRATAVANGGYDVEGAGTITLGTIALVFTLIKADSWGWTSGRTSRRLRRRCRADRCVPRHRAPPKGSAGPTADLLQPQPCRRGRDAARHGGRVVRNVLLPHALHPAGAWFQRTEDRHRLHAAERDADRLVGRRVPLRRPLYAEARAHRRPSHLNRRVHLPHRACPVTATMEAMWCPR